MDNLRCPQCESPNVVQVDTDRYECPYCGKTFNRQEALAAQHATTQKIENQKKKNERSGKLITTLTILFFVLAVVVIIGYAINEVRQPDSPKNTNEEVVDTLETDVNEAVVEEFVEEDMSNDEAATEFITDMFNQHKYEDSSFLEKNCTSRMLKKLSDENDYEGYEGYAVWIFRSEAQDYGPAGDKYGIIDIRPYGDEEGLYQYDFYDSGFACSKLIKLVRDGSSFKIDDVRDLL